MAYQYPPAADPAAAAAAAAAYQPAAQWGAPPAGYAPPYGAPPAGYYGAPAPYQPHPDELRTLFLTGFPADVKERELNNLLRFLPGYEASQLHVAGAKSAQAQGFALFDSGASAQNALRSISNLVFEEGTVLRCEMARKNMYIKDDSSTKRSRYDGQFASYGGASAYAAPAPYYGGGAAAASPQPQGYQAISNTKDNPPCNTLFIGNLGDATDENELRQIFGGLAGFRQIKLNRGGRGITCFVEFSDVASAMAVHQSQQGAVLQSSDRGGIRIQYSKNPFGKKRDYGGNYVNDSSPFSPPQQHTADAPAYDQQPQQQEAAAVKAEAPSAADDGVPAAPAFEQQQPTDQMVGYAAEVLQDGAQQPAGGEAVALG